MTDARPRLANPLLELGSAVAALTLAVVLGAVLLRGGAIHLRHDNTVAFFDSIFLGPLLALAGAWLDTQLRQPLGVLVLALGVLFALDGVFATYLAGLPALVLVLISFFTALMRRKRHAPEGGPADD
jgi:hypothetical protein